jgi:hypothetical protein
MHPHATISNGQARAIDGSRSLKSRQSAHAPLRRDWQCTSWHLTSAVRPVVHFGAFAHGWNRRPVNEIAF